MIGCHVAAAAPDCQDVLFVALRKELDTILFPLRKRLDAEEGKDMLLLHFVLALSQKGAWDDKVLTSSSRPALVYMSIVMLSLNLSVPAVSKPPPLSTSWTLLLAIKPMIPAFVVVARQKFTVSAQMDSIFTVTLL